MKQSSDAIIMYVFIAVGLSFMIISLLRGLLDK